MPRDSASIPECSSRATRRAIMVCASMISPVRNEIIDQRPRRYDVIRRDDADRHNVLRGDDDGIGSHGHHRIEIARGERVLKIAQIVGEKRMDQREVGCSAVSNR